MKPQPEPSTQEVLAGLVEGGASHPNERGLFGVLGPQGRGQGGVPSRGEPAPIVAGGGVGAAASSMRLPRPWMRDIAVCRRKS